MMKQSQPSKCTVCQSGDLYTSLSLGMQPPSNRFLAAESDSATTEERYPLSLGYCKQCGTIQLVDRMPIEAMRPRYGWLLYNEPEGHLDDVASKLKDLPGISASSRFVGVTYKDKSTMGRMNKLGFANTACISEGDLECQTLPFGLETIQSALSSAPTIARLQGTYAKADVLLVRHIVEHASDASAFIRSLRGLLAPNGYMMFELPDSERIFRVGNHAFIWEEHISYFTEASVRQLAKAVGAELVWLRRYPYPYEDSLIVLFRFAGANVDAAELLSTSHVTSVTVLAEFTTGLNASRTKWRKKLEAYRARGEKIAVFGAGHLAAKFINFYELTDLINCVIDDHPKKIGMLMPGSHLPIVPSTELLAKGIRVCVSTLSPESEVKVRGKLASYFETGAHLIPAFAAA